MKIYGYCRISTQKQSIERQKRNILNQYPTAALYGDAWTGTTTDRPSWNKLLKRIQPGDLIVFDSVSRMSRSAAEGVELYEKLFQQGVELVFLKEPHINTEVYRKAIRETVPLTETDVDLILKGVNAYLIRLAKRQVEISFEQAEKEVQDLHQRTKEGIETARLNGKQIGQRQGAKLTTKKSIAAKEIIQKHSKAFDGTLNDIDCRKLAGISRNSYYKYKKELAEEIIAEITENS